MATSSNDHATSSHLKHDTKSLSVDTNGHANTEKSKTFKPKVIVRKIVDSLLIHLYDLDLTTIYPDSRVGRIIAVPLQSESKGGSSLRMMLPPHPYSNGIIPKETFVTSAKDNKKTKVNTKVLEGFQPRVVVHSTPDDILIRLQNLDLTTFYPDVRASRMVSALLQSDGRSGSSVAITLPNPLYSDANFTREVFLTSLANFNFKPTINCSVLFDFQFETGMFCMRGDSCFFLGLLHDKKCVLSVNTTLPDSALKCADPKQSGLTVFRRISLDKLDGSCAEFDALVIGRIFVGQIVSTWVMMMVEVPNKGKQLYALNASKLGDNEKYGPWNDDDDYDDDDDDDYNHMVCQVDDSVQFGGNCPVVLFGGLDLLARDSEEFEPVSATPLEDVVAWSSMRGVIVGEVIVA